MTITRRIAIGYAVMSVVCMVLLAWLGYHEFIEEAEEFAARGLTDVHQDTAAEISTVCFLGIVPLLLAGGWLWMRRVFAPLRALTSAAEKIASNNLHEPIPRSNNNDEVDRLAGVLESMTARLDASFQQIREFTLHASHELKTPLTVIRAQLETALSDPPSASGPRAAEWIDGLLDEVQRLTKIVDSLTLLTKADAGLIALERKPVQLRDIVEEAREDATFMAQPHGVRVEAGRCDEVTVEGDRHRLRQLLLILTDNAVKYNRPDGAVHFSLHRDDGVAELRIVNDGDGVAPGTRKRLFGRFVRGENATGKVEGCGLGLTIAEWIVRAHGGTIELRFGEDEKVTAVVRLPLSGAVGREVPAALSAV